MIKQQNHRASILSTGHYEPFGCELCSLNQLWDRGGPFWPRRSRCIYFIEDKAKYERKILQINNTLIKKESLICENPEIMQKIKNISMCRLIKMTKEEYAFDQENFDKRTRFDTIRLLFRTYSKIHHKNIFFLYVFWIERMSLHYNLLTFLVHGCTDLFGTRFHTTWRILISIYVYKNGNEKL